MKFYIKNRKRRSDEYFYFMQSFVETAIACGIKQNSPVVDIHLNEFEDE